ncbi:hypothetical protein RQP46_006378 [Phenoliferia psychrophenolica]
MDPGKAFVGGSSPRLAAADTFNPNRDPLAQLASPRFGSTSPFPSPGPSQDPRFSFSGVPGHRKGSSASLYPSSSPLMKTPSGGMWSSIFPPANLPLQLPSHRRPFYPAGGPLGHQAGIRNFLRNALLRPIYVLNRRGPFVPSLVLFLLVTYFVVYSTHPSSQSVKLRVQGAVGPYIPQRAANAIKWRGKQDAFQLQHGGELAPGALGHGGGVGEDDLDVLDPKPPTIKESAPLPPTRRDGRVLIESGKAHPILALMREAKIKWATMKASQSRTFRQAVAEYVRRNGRRPPKGFDKWYAFSRAHNVLLIDEFDLINKDLYIYRAFKPSSIRLRLEHLLAEYDKTWIIRVVNGDVLREGELEDHDRAHGISKLMSRFAHELPDMKIAYNGHDGARVGVAAVERERLEGIIKRGEYDLSGDPFKPELKGREPYWGMTVFCPTDSVVGAADFEYGWPEPELTGLEMPPAIPGSIGSVVGGDLRAYLDVCNSPQYRHFHATTSWVYSHHPQPLAPLFTPGVQTTFADVHSLIVEQFELEQTSNPLWEDRPFTSLQWRGQTSGPLWEASTPWRTTQRARLHLLSHAEKGSRDVVVTDENDHAFASPMPNYRVNPLFLDTGMVGPAVQCVEEDGTCEKMFEVFQGYDKRISFDRASLYKYVLDVDGNSWSGRFRRLMLSNAAVVKATVFTEFWTDWAIPWLHFIPIQVDYSDMWDVMSFFRGDLAGNGAHDDLAKEIAEAGKEWVGECFRWADLEAYQYRLLLEYARIYNDEKTPGSNDFNGDDAVEPTWTGDVTSSTRSNPPSSPSKDKEKIRQWTFPRPSGDSPSHSPSSGAMLSGERSAAGGGGGPGASAHAAQGLSSATSPTGAGTEPAWNNHTLASLAESAPPSPTPQSTPRFSFPDSPPPATRTANAQHPRAHRPNTSIAYSSAATSSLPLRSRLNPVVLTKILYSNLRRSSLNDLAYGLVFLASLLIFFGALSGQGYHAQDHVEKDQPQRRVPDKPHGGARVWPVLNEQQQQQQRAAAIEVDIPKAFLPVEEDDGEVPADVYQPHGDSSHDRGADFLRDSPEDPDLDDDQTHKVPIRRGREALFGKHTDEHGATHREQEALLAAEHAESLLSNDEEDAEADEDAADEPEHDDDDDDTPLLPPEAASHEDSFIAHPLHIIEEDAGDLSPPDFFNADPPPPPRAPPVIIMADEPHDEDTAAAQELGDSFRRPAGRQGIEETKEQRAAMGREREREHWEENVDAERGDAVEEAIAGVARQRHAREVR